MIKKLTLFTLIITLSSCSGQYLTDYEGDTSNDEYGQSSKPLKKFHKKPNESVDAYND